MGSEDQELRNASTIDAEQVAAAVRRIERRTGLELQWDLREHDDGMNYWLLALHVIVERPGPHHSRYSTIEVMQFDAQELEQRRGAHRIAAAVAGATDLPLHAPPVEDRGGWGDSAWIRTQPMGDPHAYELAWEARWWTDHGEPAHAAGIDHVPASSGRDANMLLSRDLYQRFPSRPLSVHITGGWRYGDSSKAASWPAILPDRESVREVARVEDCRASAIARDLVARVPDVTALALMIVFNQSFLITFKALGPLAAWRKGVLDDVGLDAALPHIAHHRDNWDRPRRLRAARAVGNSIAALVRAEDPTNAWPIQIMKDLREAFGISLSHAKEIVNCCGDPRRDTDLDALLPR